MSSSTSPARGADPRRHDDGAALLDVVDAQHLEGVMAKRRDTPVHAGAPVTVVAQDQAPPSRRAGRRRMATGRGRARGSARGVAGRLPRRRRRAALRRPRRQRVLAIAELDDLERVVSRRSPSTRTRSRPRCGGCDAPGARFVRPELVVEVAFGEWTPDGRLRHPSYLGRRFDKPATRSAAPDAGSPAASSGTPTSTEEVSRCPANRRT